MNSNYSENTILSNFSTQNASQHSSLIQKSHLYLNLFDTFQSTEKEIDFDSVYDLNQTMINLEEFYYNNRLPNFLLQKQKFINPQMRTILLNWILEVTSQLGFKRETYHLTVFLIDSFLQNYENLQTSDFQLLGVTCLMISSKFEVRIYNYKNN